jgi:FlaA1/EpsC-like NDP-sugar epimerase
MSTWSGEAGAKRRVFVLGTSSRADLALRFLREQQIECAGFIDTNGGSDLKRYIFGRPVLGRLDDLARLSAKYGVSEVVLLDFDEVLLQAVSFQSICQRQSLRVTRLGLYDHSMDERVMGVAVNA